MKTKSNTAKLLYIVFVVLMAAVVISAIIFMNEYRWILVYSDKKGVIAARTSGYDPNLSNMFVFDFFTKKPGMFIEYPSREFSDYASIVLNFQNNINELCYQILALGCVGVVCVCISMILANHNRKVYYISNLLSGLVCSLIIAIFGLVVLVNVINLLGQFENNSILFNIVAALQGSNQIGASLCTTREAFTEYFTCSSVTFYIYIVLLIMVICYSVFMMIYTIMRYKGSAERRKEILSRVVKNDD